MAGNIELLSNTDNFTIGTNSNLEEILANVVKIGRDTSNVTLSIPQDINSSYNLILPARQGASGESLVYNKDGQLIWHDPTVLKQVISVYGPNLTGNLSSTGTQDSPTYLDNYQASISPKSENSKIFVQFKVNYHASLSASNQISFYIKKTDNNGNTISIFSESLFGPYNGVGGFTGQYISNLVDQATSTEQITYQLGYKVNGNVLYSDILGILGYDTSYNNTIVLQEFEGSGSNATSVWNKGSDSNGLYYNDGTVHIGSTKNALGSQSTPGVALELSGNLVGTNANFSGDIAAHSIKMGTIDAALNHQGIAHSDRFDSTNYALKQRPDGLTEINCTSGKYILFRTGNSHPPELAIYNNFNQFNGYVFCAGSRDISLSRVRYDLQADNSGDYWVVPENQSNIPTTTGWTTLGLRVESAIYGSTYYQSSDDRRKHNELKYIDGDGIRVINKLQPLIYEKTEKLYDYGETRPVDDTNYIIESGFIAQEVLKIPELSFAVRGGDYVNEEGENVKQEYSLDYQSIWTVAVKAIQELSADITQFKESITQLKERITQLEGN